MWSDSDYDDMFYNSSQHSSSIDDQIDRFEFQYYVKSQRSKQKRTTSSSCPISRRYLQSQVSRVRMTSMHDKKTLKAERKPFRYERYPRSPEVTTSFKCDEQLQSTSTDTCQQTKRSKVLDSEHRESFVAFRRHFYHTCKQSITSAFDKRSDVRITDIRLAPIDESVQKDFMKQLQHAAHYPYVVYHGTALTNMKGILRYGLLIPNRAHPSNDRAPIIRAVHGQAYGPGIYCSETADYSLCYMKTTNTLLVCAALPNRDKSGRVQRHCGNILVIGHVARIIPLFLLDFKYLNQSNINHPCFHQPKQEIKIVKNKTPEKSTIISRKYLRRLLNCINDKERMNNRYQERSILTCCDV